MTQIHPTALISSKAQLAENVSIGAYVIIEDDVQIDEGTKIAPHACIYNGARIGKNVKIFQGASVSNIPQDLKYANEESLFYIGDNTTIREFATLHRGTVETRFSKIGNNCLLMAYTHVAHDCVIGNNVILANSVQIGGHVHLEDYVIIGGSTPIHQFVKIGQHAMVGGGFRVTVDIPPYILAGSEPLRYTGLNTIGLRRRGFSRDDMEILKETYALIFGKELNLSQAKDIVKEKYGNHPLVKNVLEFLSQSTRGLIKR